MTTSPLRSLLLSRRSWLASALLPAVAAQDTKPQSRATQDQIAGTEQILGLEFNPTERTQMLAQVRENLAGYTAVRKETVPWHLDPCLRFDPLPAGIAPPPEEGEPAWEPLPDAGEPGDEPSIAFASVEQLATWLRQKKVTSMQLTELALRRLARFDAKLLCVVTLLAESAKAAAERADAEIAAGKIRSPLHGIPFGAKDLFAWPGAPTTFGAKPLAQQVWNETATVLQKLQDAGAVLVAKLSLGALAMGDLWFKGRTRNPWNPEQGSSGSSAGSASAVAAGLVPFALGTETLGSIVSPCSRCGVTGLRTSFGTVSRFGAMPLSWSMDKIGPIARTAADCALVYATIRGPDGKDGSVRKVAFPWRRAGALQGKKVGYARPARGGAALDPLLDALREQGASVVEATLPRGPFRELLVMLHAEAATAFDELTRDGRVRELDGQGPGDWPNQFRASRLIPAVEDPRAARVRARACREMHEVMAPLDAFVAPPFGGTSLTLTNLTGHPCVVMPLAAGDGAPSPITLIGRLYGEAALVAVAEAWQRKDRTHLRRPPLA